METEKLRLRETLLYTIGLLEELKTDGFVKGGAVSLTPEGEESYRVLKEGGFRPTKDELQIAVAMLQIAAVSVP